ncbi:hypothetical protein ACFYM2_21395 [Streptomyces sp. NPDC006711]|uniref:hypothetical protein n=1 Tax=Streptomyces sp. NPDC006711 TaxID=3364762 RepID=UPI003692798D
MTTDFPPIALTVEEWDELVFTADIAERSGPFSASVYDSIKHWVSAVLPLHERMIRERLGADLEYVQVELTEARQKVRICEEKLATADRDIGQLIDERDHRGDVADKLAYAVAPEEVIGEHSSMNCPWENAYELITPMAEVDALRQEVARLRQENEDLLVGLGLGAPAVIA